MYMYNPMKNCSFCHCFHSFIMQWFPSVAMLKEKVWLLYLEQYLKILLLDGTEEYIVMTAAVSASIAAYSTGK